MAERLHCAHDPGVAIWVRRPYHAGHCSLLNFFWVQGTDCRNNAPMVPTKQQRVWQKASKLCGSVLLPVQHRHVRALSAPVHGCQSVSLVCGLRGKKSKLCLTCGVVCGPDSMCSEVNGARAGHSQNCTFIFVVGHTGATEVSVRSARRSRASDSHSLNVYLSVFMTTDTLQASQLCEDSATILTRIASRLTCHRRVRGEGCTGKTRRRVMDSHLMCVLGLRGAWRRVA